MLPSRPSVMVDGGALQSFSGGGDFVGESLSEAAVISYYLKKRHMFGDIMVNIYDEQDNLIKSIPAGKRRGINRVNWPMRLKPPKFPPSNALTGGFFGPRVAVGKYKVELVKGKKTYAGTVDLVADPRSTHSEADRKMQNQLSMKLYNNINDLTYMINKLDDLKNQASKLKAELPKSNQKKITKFNTTIKSFTHSIASHKKGMITGEEKLKEKLGTLFGNVTGYNGKPSHTQFASAENLEKQLSKALQEADKIVQNDLNQLNKMLKKSKLKSLILLSRETWNKDNGMGQVVPKNWAFQMNQSSLFSLF
jgi:predicted DNA binding protein